MGLFDTITTFARKSVATAGRRFGEFGGAVKRFGAVMKPTLKRVGQFAIDNHQGLALLAHGVADATGNEHLKTLAGVGMMGSAALTAAGIGRDYLNARAQA